MSTPPAPSLPGLAEPPLCCFAASVCDCTGAGSTIIVPEFAGCTLDGPNGPAGQIPFLNKTSIPGSCTFNFRRPAGATSGARAVANYIVNFPGTVTETWTLRVILLPFVGSPQQLSQWQTGGTRADNPIGCRGGALQLKGAAPTLPLIAGSGFLGYYTGCGGTFSNITVQL